ncbi:pentapeptide repeat-containing protein [Aquisalimonas sp.]|uniref:pentapeptide repeat-containing protein n=1 Tax=Aquisalimonas sp. TaxID=1872621 RepID=UPI0025B99A35|nr:pentapeptide repeat-containing protein [Aquisalimonas sp.]
MDDEALRNAIRGAMHEELRERGGERQLTKRRDVYLMPVTITIVSLLVTAIISIFEARNTRIIADSHIESAREIANAQRLNQVQEAEKDREIQQIGQITPIFQKVIDEYDPSDEIVEKVATEISALSVYRNTALEYLVKISQHYESRSEVLHEAARDTIDAIISNSQIDLSGFQFDGRTMRISNLSNYNLSGSTFNGSNLYGSDLTQAHLINTEFDGTDLHSVNFQGANLTNAKFGPGGTIRNADFRRSRLDGVTFDECVWYIEDAQFTLGAVLNADRSPFESMDPRRYVWLLQPHADELAAVESFLLQPVLDKLNLDSRRALLSRLDTLDETARVDMGDCPREF